MKRKYIECSCGCNEHRLCFLWDSDPEFSIIYLSIFLNPHHGFWRRLWLGIKYIFGFNTSKYGHFDETLLTYEQVKQLKNLCNDFLTSHIQKKET